MSWTRGGALAGRALGHLDLGLAVSAKITALEEERRAAMAAWIDARLAIGQHEQLVPHLRELLAENRLDERTWAQLIAALGGAGRTAEALTTYQQARRLLLDEIAVEPGAELRRVHTALLNGEPLTPVTRTVARSVSSNGSAVACRAETHVFRSAVMPRDIPAVPPGFVGRTEVRRELAQIARRLDATSADGACATVVAISGPPGAGKTATAITTAYEVAHLFPEARHFEYVRLSAKGLFAEVANVAVKGDEHRFRHSHEQVALARSWSPAHTERAPVMALDVYSW